MTCKVPIGSQYQSRPSMFDRRTGFGDFQRYLPELDADACRLQTALIGRRRVRSMWPAAAGIVGVVLMVMAL